MEALLDFYQLSARKLQKRPHHPSSPNTRSPSPVIPMLHQANTSEEARDGKQGTGEEHKAAVPKVNFCQFLQTARSTPSAVLSMSVYSSSDR